MRQPLTGGGMSTVIRYESSGEILQCVAERSNAPTPLAIARMSLGDPALMCDREQRALLLLNH